MWWVSFLLLLSKFFVFDFSGFHFTVSVKILLDWIWMGTYAHHVPTYPHLSLLIWLIVSTIFYLNKVFAPFSITSPCGTSTMWILFPLMASHNLYRLSSVFYPSSWMIWNHLIQGHRFFSCLIKLAGLCFIFHFIHCVLQLQNLIPFSFFFLYLGTSCFLFFGRTMWHAAS